MRDNFIPHKESRGFQIGGFLDQVFVQQKLNNWVGYLLMALIAGLFGYLVARQTVLGLSVFALVIGLFTFVVCLLSTEVGLYINLVYSFFAFFLSRYLFGGEFPVGMVTDILIVTTFLSLFTGGHNLKKSFNTFAATPVVICLLVLVFYLLIELVNPAATSFEGWFQTFRRFIESVLLLFIAYQVFSSYNAIKRFIIVLFAFCTLTAIYGCIQQWHGLFAFEINWVIADENRYGLFYINGNFRKFSTFSDPTAFGVVMAAASIFFLILAFHQKRPLYRFILLAGIAFMLLAMAYSGTRTANVMVVGGGALFILLRLNRKETKVFAVVATLAFLFLLYAPIYSNETINRFRTTFIGGREDESFKVREINRAFIQPYIYSHPIGGGLGTAGAGGLKYSPGHYLAGFPPDSGYLKKALETGWIGLALICILYFIILKYGINGYFRSRREVNKVLYAAVIPALFSFYIAEFAQEAIGQITDVVVYYPMVALILKLRVFENETEPEAA